MFLSSVFFLLKLWILQQNFIIAENNVMTRNFVKFSLVMQTYIVAITLPATNF